MPIPKEKQEEYGKILGHMLNMGKGKEEAKDIADRAIVSKKGKKKRSKRK